MLNRPEEPKKKGSGCCIAAFIVVAVLLVLGVVIAVTIGPKAFEWGKQLITEQQERAEWSQNWQPPAETLDYALFFPKKVGDFQQSSHDAYWEIVEKPGIHALYTAGPIERYVSVYQMTAQEQTQFFGRLEDIFEQFKESFSKEHRGGHSTTQGHIGNRFSYSIKIGDARRRFVVWWIKGWLFQFSGEDEEELYPFIEEYLAATTKQTA
jgi:hypothetical protein